MLIILLVLAIVSLFLDIGVPLAKVIQGLFQFSGKK